MVVASEICRTALNRRQFCTDLLLVVCQRLGDRCKMPGKFGIFGLRGKSLGPVEREIEVAVAVIGLPYLGAR